MGIRLKLGLTVALITSVVVLLVTFGSGYLVRGELHRAAMHRLASQVEKETIRAQALLLDARADLSTLASSPEVLQLTRALSATPVRGSALHSVEKKFLNFAEHHYYVMQLRLLDSTGMERARVNRDSRSTTITSKDLLQDKSDRDYYLESRKLAPGQIYVSTINLNREHGKIERPVRPTVRLVAPVTMDTGVVVGFVVLNMRADQLITSKSDAHELLVADQDGSLLRHPHGRYLFGRDLGHDARLGTLGRADFDWQQLGESGTKRMEVGLAAAEPTLISYRKVHYSELAPAAYWLFIAEQTQAEAFAQAAHFMRTFLAIGFGLVPVVGLIAFALGTLMTRRVVSLAGTVRRLADGDVSVRTGQSSGDEIGQLAGDFDRMAGQLTKLLADEREVAARLQVTNQELERSNADLAQFAHATAHDLRTPLRALATFPVWIDEALQTVPDVPEIVGEHLERMRLQVRRMETLLSDMLAYSSVGSQESLPTVVQPDEVIRGVIALSAPGPAFQVEVECSGLPIHVVLPELELLLRNLVGNAIKHHDRDQGHIAVTCEGRVDGFSLKVADDGPGILPKHREKVFKVFQTLSRRKGDGNGIGLALVKKIVDRWHGEITLDFNDDERGSVFTVDVAYAEPLRLCPAGALVHLKKRTPRASLSPAASSP